MTQLVLLLTTLTTALHHRCQELEDDSLTQRLKYVSRLERAQAQLSQATDERDEAEQLRREAHCQAEQYRQAVADDHLPALLPFAARSAPISPLSLSQVDELLERNEQFLSQAHHALDDLRAQLGLAPAGQPRNVRGQLADDSEARSGAGIVATLGPATDTPEQLTALMAAVMSVARLNLRHGTHAEHAQLCHRLREADARTGRRVVVLADLPGPQIRMGTFMEGPVFLEAGEAFTLTTEDVEGGIRFRIVSPGRHVLAAV